MQAATLVAETSREIAVLDDCRRAIAEADDLDQLSDLRSRAEAIRVWAKSANESLEVQNRAAELRLLAERKAGKMLSQMGLKGGDRKSNGHDDRLKLSDVGITQNQSKWWQRAATISDQQFTDYGFACKCIAPSRTPPSPNSFFDPVDTATNAGLHSGTRALVAA